MKIAIACAAAVLVAGLTAAAEVATYEPDLLDVKFKEGTTVRLRDGVPADVGDSVAVRSDVQGIIAAFARGQWSRTHAANEEVLDRLRTDGQRNSAKSLPDLNNYMRLRLPQGLTAAHAKEILERYPSVEAAYFVPKPFKAPLPPDYSAPPAPTYQDYLDAAPSGIDARDAWSRGWNGAGVKVCDVEYWINRNHADLPPITALGNFGIDPFQDDHGTSVMGIIAAKDNGWGTKGIASGVSAYYTSAYTSAGYNIPRGIMECGAALSAGDVVLIEQQIAGPYGGSYPVPPEWSKPVYDAILTLVANGIVVVETTGNGGVLLDDPIFSTGNDGHYPFLLENDSGALLVTGATSPHAGSPRTYWYWTTAGATVDLQGWGDSIVTTGNGNLYAAEGQNLFYRSDFSGSSGAAPMIAGGAAILEQAHKALYGTPAPPALIKQVLVSTGTPQLPPATYHLGPLPNLKAALNAMGQVYYVDAYAYGANNGTSWANAYSELQDALAHATAGARILVAEGYYRPDWNPATHTYTNDRAATFQLKNGVTLLGGFPSGGGARDPATYYSVLNGDIGALYDNTDNSYHIVSAGAGIDDTAVLDGFKIWSANANGAYPYDRGPAIYLSGGSPVLRELHVAWNFGGAGGGIYNENGSPSLQSVTIAFNRATTGGGGMWNQGGGPRITDAYFYQNGATGEGGGLFTQGGSPHIERTVFAENFGTRGGGISNWPGGSLVVDSSEFRNNYVTADIGGGVFNWQGLLRLNNVTMSGNNGPYGGGGIYLFDANTVTIRNSIFWGNTGGEVNGNVATVSNSLISGGYPGTANLGTDPLFRVPGSDLRLKPGSPAMNAGDPATCAADDVRGVFRDNACDMGAYEYRGNPGTYWSNGEVDLLHAAASYDSIPVGGNRHQSADDFTVPPGTVCEVSGFRGVLQDGTKAAEAVLQVYTDAAGVPGGASGLVSVHAFCASNPSQWCADTTDCGGDTCVLPGESLGSRNGARLWEPRFSVNWRFGPGTYWVSIYGTVEPGSSGLVSMVTAGDGSIRSNPYRLRDDYNAPWVDGGAHDGDADRDLALEVDAVCLPDADGDLSPAGEDCDDNDPNRSPQYTEECNGYDDNCDGIADAGYPPYDSPKLTFNSRTQLAWTSVDLADSYDVVRGDLDNLRASGGDFSTGSCEASQVIGNTYDIQGAQPHSGLWYLVRPRNNICGAGYFDDWSASEVPGRDTELAASTGACP